VVSATIEKSKVDIKLVSVAVMEEARAEIAKVIADNAPAEMDAATVATITRRVVRGLGEFVVAEAAKVGIANNIRDPAFAKIYAAYYMRLIMNLDPTSSLGSRYLLDGLYSGRYLDMHAIAGMSSAEMNPEATREIREMLELRLRQKVDVKFSEAYLCRRCGARKATINETQNRAADEQSTINLECLACGYKWRK
jgi:DNA-directed RNA polymerase subunit M/transcription elongation factor TFIIS